MLAYACIGYKVFGTNSSVLAGSCVGGSQDEARGGWVIRQQRNQSPCVACDVVLAAALATAARAVGL